MSHSLRRRRLLALLPGLLGSAAAPGLRAQPADVVRIVVPFPPGNVVDAGARKLAEALNRLTGKTYVVDNRPGVGGVLGTTEVSRAKADGRTLLYTTGSHTTTAVLQKKLAYDPVGDFTPITKLTGAPGFVLLVAKDSPYRKLDELLAAARAKPGSISYASGGVGNPTHLVAALFERAAGLQLIHVPYKSNPVPDLIGGHVEMLFWGTALSKPLLEEGRVRALAMSGNQRWPVLPDVPALAEFGWRDVQVAAWAGLFAGGRLPGPLAEALYRDIRKAHDDKSLLEFAAATDSTVVLSTPAQFSADLRAEIDGYRARLQPLGISLD